MFKNDTLELKVPAFQMQIIPKVTEPLAGPLVAATLIIMVFIFLLSH